MSPMIEDNQLAELHEGLVSQARQFEDPFAYVAGVEDAINAVRRLLAVQEGTVVLPEPRAARML
ncbi:MAG TPA: hypothetical protein VHF25_00115 [Nitriliruptorales bacterium]|nr:hypothetical protein [Nitriliruptorales bacterium]